MKQISHLRVLIGTSPISLNKHLVSSRSRRGRLRADPLRQGPKNNLPLEGGIITKLCRLLLVPRHAEIGRPVRMGEGSRAYAMNGCKRAYSHVWRALSSEIHEWRMVAGWVLAGMRVFHPSVSEEL